MAFERLQAQLSSILAALLPSFLRQPSSTSKPRRIHSTAYLDGLRGVASLFVVFAHYESTHFTFLDQAWHEPPKETHASNDYVLQMPIIRTMYTGQFMITIFFIISGHVLSQKALSLAKRQNYTDFLKSLASSVFRRWLRLMLPALSSSFLVFLAGLFGWLTKIPPGWDAEHTPVLEPLYTAQDLTLSSWVIDALSLINPFRFGDIMFPKFNYPLWTMPVEYTGSMIVFLILVGTSLLRNVLRLVLLASLVGYCLWLSRWAWSVFICGVLIADLFAESSPARGAIPLVPLTSDIDDEEFEPPTWYTTYAEHWVDSLQKYKNRCPKFAFHIVDFLLFLLALYIGSTPPATSDTLALTPGYKWLSPWLPTGWGTDIIFFYPAIGAMLLAFVLAQSKFLQGIFTTRIAQYLGDVSLSLYMLHILVLHSLGNWLIVKCLSIMPHVGGWGFAIGITTLSCSAIVTFWVADIFCRLVDTPSVELTRLLAALAFVQDKPSLSLT